MDSRNIHRRRYILTAIATASVIAILLISAYSPVISSDIGKLTASQTYISNSSSTSTQATSTSTTMALKTTNQTTTIEPVITKVDTNPGLSCNLTPKSSGLVIPVFSSYSPTQQQDVNEIIQAKNQYPSVPMIAAINPGDGPASYNSNISKEISNLISSNVTVIGYVPTDWAERNISSVEADIKTFYSWYHVQGIYLDQMPNWEYNGPQGQRYYPGPNGTYIPLYFATLTDYIKSLGMSCVLGNSGADVPQNFLGTVSIIGIFENAFTPPFFGDISLPGYNGSLTGYYEWHLQVSKSNFAFFSYNISSFDPYYFVAASDYVGWLYLCNGSQPQPYGILPPYFEQMVSTLSSVISLNVKSEVQNGTKTVTGGFAVIVTQPDGVSSKGFTPFAFNLLPGSNVTVSADNFGAYTFSHWSDGNTNRVRTLVLNSSTTLIAYYDTQS